MAGPIRPHHGKVHETSKPQKKGYSRELNSARNATELASSGIIKDNIPNYQAYLQSAHQLKNRVTRNPQNKNAGTADHVWDQMNNRSWKTRMAPYIRGTAALL